MFLLTAGIDLSGIHPPSYSVIFAILCPAVIFFCFGIIALVGPEGSYKVVLPLALIAGLGTIIVTIIDNVNRAIQVDKVATLINTTYGLDTEKLPDLIELPREDYLSEPIMYPVLDENDPTITHNVVLYLRVENNNLTFEYGGVLEEQTLTPLTGNIKDVVPKASKKAEEKEPEATAKGKKTAEASPIKDPFVSFGE